eukprot:gene11334-11422_t
MGSYGVAAAAQTYFGKSLDQLTVAECAFLASLPKAPATYHPIKEQKQEAKHAQSDPFKVTIDSSYIVNADYFGEEVRRELMQRFGENVLYTGGLSVFTTVDPFLQNAADKSLRDVVLVNNIAGPGQTPVYELHQIPAVSGGMVVMDADTGNVFAMTGGYSFEISQFNCATQAWRQPGSAFKPFVYLAALEKGYTPETLINDAPITLNLGAGLGVYSPKNITHRSYGPSPMRIGIEKSYNLMTVRLAHQIGELLNNWHDVEKKPLPELKDEREQIIDAKFAESMTTMLEAVYWVGKLVLQMIVKMRGLWGSFVMQLVALLLLEFLLVFQLHKL